MTDQVRIIDNFFLKARTNSQRALDAYIRETGLEGNRNHQIYTFDNVKTNTIVTTRVQKQLALLDKIRRCRCISFQLGGSDRRKWSPITFARSHSELQVLSLQ